MSRALSLLALAMVTMGLLPSVAAAQGTLSATYTTQPHGGNYAPRNVVAVWVEGPAGAFVMTIDRWAATRRQHLVAWTQQAGAADADAVSGATRASHTGALTATWDLRDKLGNEVPDGTYTIRMELADSNATTAGQNAQGTFTFVKNGTAATQPGLSSGGFTGVTIAYAPAAAAASCGDGVLDADETCDPVGSCPTSCPASAEPCMVNTLTGSAAGCTAECVEVPVPDCGAPAADGEPATLTGGCTAAGRGAGPVGAALGLTLVALLATRRRRRR